MINARMIRDEKLGAYRGKIELDGTLTELTIELAHIVRKVYQIIGEENAEDAAAMRAALIGAMTHPDLDFWSLGEEPEAMQS